MSVNDVPASNQRRMFTRSSSDNRADDGFHISARITPPNGFVILVTAPIETPAASTISRYDLPCAANLITKWRTSALNRGQVTINLQDRPTLPSPSTVATIP